MRLDGKSTVSEMFIERTRTALGELMSRRLDDVRLAVMMLDGMEIAERTHVVALGISTEGVKIPLGLWEGSTENATLARTLLADLVDRGLDPEQAILFVIDGGKALRRAIKDVFGEHALVHRCHRHKERNVTDLLPERDRPAILAKIRGAWALKDADLAEQRLEQLASELERTWPDAAGSLREGHERDADADAPRDRRPARQDAVLNEPVRVDDRDRPLHAAQRQALAGRRHAQALDRRRDARRRAAVPADHRLPRPRQARDRDRASRRPVTARRDADTVTPTEVTLAQLYNCQSHEDRRQSSTTIRTSSHRRASGGLLQESDSRASSSLFEVAEGWEGELAEEDYLIGYATPDAYGVPLNIIGNRSEEFFAALGRIVGLGATLENKILGFLQYLVGRDQQAHTELSVSRLIEMALKELHRLPQAERKFAEEFLADAKAITTKRND